MPLTVNDFIKFVQCLTVYDGITLLQEHNHSFLMNFQQNQCIVLLDFAENYIFIVQDAIQGHHWNNSQVTLHPFVIYFKNEKKQLHGRNLCIISDCLKHNANTVYTFISKIMPLIKKNFQTSVYYIPLVMVHQVNIKITEILAINITIFMIIASSLNGISLQKAMVKVPVYNTFMTS